MKDCDDDNAHNNCNIVAYIFWVLNRPGPQSSTSRTFSASHWLSKRIFRPILVIISFEPSLVEVNQAIKAWSLINSDTKSNQSAKSAMSAVLPTSLMPFLTQFDIKHNNSFPAHQVLHLGWSVFYMGLM